MPKQRVFYGWVNVALFFLIAQATWGPQYSFGVFFKPLVEEFGWTRAQTSGAMTLNLIVGGFLGFVAGVAADRYGPRKVMWGVGIFIGAGYLMMSRLTTLWQLYLWFGLVAGIGVSAAYIVPASTISRWFVAKRGLGLGIALMGMGFSQILVPPVLANLILNVGWRSTYAIIGGGVLAVVLLLASFLRKSPEDYGLGPDGIERRTEQNTTEKAVAPDGLLLKQAIRLPALWLLCLLWVFIALPGFLTVVHIVPLATDVNPGISARTAALIISVIGLTGLTGRLFFGYASDRWGCKKTVVLCLVLMTVAMVELMFARSLSSFIIAAIVFGAGFNGADTATIKMVGDFFGRRAIGAVMGLTGTGFRIGAASGALIGGAVYDATTSYQASFATAALCSMIAVALVFIIFRHKPHTA
ncbi:MAG: MFS transporter [Dehalococcoidia bacterium]|nr:MFS transporter [Dehalococcoidia bacterium]